MSILHGVRPFRLDDTDASRGIIPVVILWVTSHKHIWKMISPDKSLHPVKLNNLLQVNKHNKITQYMNEIY